MRELEFWRAPPVGAPLFILDYTAALFEVYLGLVADPACPPALLAAATFAEYS